eukprot:TRINITY_DN618_c0_g1_i1.p1 TRINITY_DN618_c0_g1~~TRINITY_DN618_c0_g1_i1.p1  ORF type:complete len:234 (-),score=38.98 TRINITY_DN618_c0_g1_i1:118-819(-)
MSRRWAPCVLALLSSLSGGVGIEVDVDNGVLVLNQSNFDAVLKKHSVLVVHFYKSDSRECQVLAKSFSKAAKSVRKMSSDIRLGKVDVVLDSSLAQVHGVDSAPMVLGWKDGQFVQVYTGPREKEEIADFARALTGPAGIIWPRLFYSKVRFSFKMMLRATPLGKNARRLFSTGFPVLLLFAVLFPFLFYWCCCGSSTAIVPPSRSSMPRGEEMEETSGAQPTEKAETEKKTD